MMIMKLTILGCLLVSGCISPAMLRELKEDSAVIGFTGVYAKLGVTPSPTAGNMPLPSIEFGYGTAWRVGKHDKVTVAIGSNNGIDLTNANNGTMAGSATPSPAQIVPKLSSISSLYINAENNIPAKSEVKTDSEVK